MSALTLPRFAYLPDATLGWLVAGVERFATLERPWLKHPDGPGGQLSRSCVPDGEYRMRPHDTRKFPGTYAIVNEDLGVWYTRRPPGQQWGRTGILIHVGNYVSDLEGCIALGMSHAKAPDGRWMVTRSKVAMTKLREIVGRAGRHELLIYARGAVD